MRKDASSPLARTGFSALDYMPADSALAQWIDDLRSINQKPYEQETWAIVSRGVLIEHDDELEVRGLLPKISSNLGMSLIVVDAEDIVPHYELWKRDIAGNLPAMVYLSPGKWLERQGHECESAFPEDPTHDAKAAYQFRKEFASFLGGESKDWPVVFVTTVATYGLVDEALRIEGCFGRKIKMPQLEAKALGEIFIGEMGGALFEHAVSAEPARLGAILTHECTDRRRRTLLQQALKRRAWREDRLLSLADVIEFAIYGTGEEGRPSPASAEELRAHAIHEAGHAVMCWMGSREKKAPAYCSVLARGGKLGIMVQPYDAYERCTNDRTFVDVIHNIRVQLAGRVAEYMALGVDSVSAYGSNSDLKNASSMARRLVAKCGLSLESGGDALFASNLAILSDRVDSAKNARVEKLVLALLQREFSNVLSVLREHRALFDRVVNALINKKVLFQSDFDTLLG